MPGDFVPLVDESMVRESRELPPVSLSSSWYRETQMLQASYDYHIWFILVFHSSQFASIFVMWPSLHHLKSGTGCSMGTAGTGLFQTYAMYLQIFNYRAYACMYIEVLVGMYHLNKCTML